MSMEKNNLEDKLKIKPKEKYDLSDKILDFLECTTYSTCATIMGGVVCIPAGAGIGAGIGAGYSFLQAISDKNPNYEGIMYGLVYGGIIGFGVGVVSGLTMSICCIRRKI